MRDAYMLPFFKRPLSIRPPFLQRLTLACVSFFTFAAAQASNDPALSTAPEAPSTPWYSTAWTHVKDTWREGDIEAYVPFLSYHLPFAYTAEKRAEYNEFPAGFGIGKGRYNKSGNWEGMYAMGFRDSHGDPSYMVGYGWVPTWNIGKSEVKAGVGLTGFLMSRKDYFGGVPFPGVLPVASIGYKNLTAQAAYIPGGQGYGNVLFVWGKWTFK
jgi:hypothetical protein